MNLISLHKHYKKQLLDIYNVEEISSFFYILCEYRLELDRVAIALQSDDALSLDDFIFFKDALLALVEQKPIQYIIGETSFYGLDFYVTPDTLIPRPETEELVEWIVSEVSNNVDRSINILDVGTGSGCIAISLAKHLPNVKVTAVDVSAKAIHIAKKNAKRNNVSVDFLELDILKTTSLPDSYDIIVSNPPYVRNEEKKEIQKNVLDYEPALALFVANELPLVFYEKITELAIKHLKQKGKLFFEINQYLANETKNLVENIGFNEVELHKDFLENDRMLKASLE